MKICTKCERYVKSQELSCPFCQGESLIAESLNAGLTAGLSRSRIFATRVALAGATIGVLVACSSSEEYQNTTGSGGVSSASSGGADTLNSGGSLQSSGGAQFATTGGSGGINIDMGGGNASVGGQGGEPVGIPIYGGPFPDTMRARV